MKGLMTMPECVGLVAGEGELPAIVVRAMLARGLDIVAIALSESIYAQLQPLVQRLHCLGAGQGNKIIEALKHEGSAGPGVDRQSEQRCAVPPLAFRQPCLARSASSQELPG